MKQRELKFREFLPSGKFHYWGFLRDGCFIGPSDPKGIHNQFTGLKDKNGKEIYEGDKLKDHSGNIWIVFWHNDHACFGVRSENNNVQSEIIDNQNMEVIGDIYSNPELLPP